MNGETIQLLAAPQLPPVVLAPAVLLLFAGWVWSHARGGALPRAWQTPAMVGRILIGFLALLGTAGLAHPFVGFATPWRLEPLLFGGATLIEAMGTLGRTERVLAGRRTGPVLGMLRAMVALGVIGTLCQPVLVLTASRKTQRRVAVLVDVSGSMQVADNAATRDEDVHLTRAELARRLLSASAGPPPSVPLLERLDRDYGVRLYTVGAFPTEAQVADLLATGATARVAAPPAGQLQGTDLAAALETATAGFRPEQLAAVLLLSDGRHNGRESVEAVARRLGHERIPVFAIPLGDARHPPVDAAIAAVDAPATAGTRERIVFGVDLKLDGLTGTNVTVTLFDGTRAVASGAITPDTPAYRGRIELTHVPATSGLRSYRVALQAFGSEVDRRNNDVAVPVCVGGDPVRMLLMDGFPRWEFRHLTSFLAEGHPPVRLQHVLFHPDTIDGLAARSPRPASPGAGQSWAARPPDREADWMAFDVVILGDVSPEDLGRRNMDTLRKYVRERGGTLIVVAGSRYMPHGYTQTPLAGILPLVSRPASRPLLTAPEPVFRLGLTAEGRNAAFMALDDDPARSAEAWDGMPELYWRHGFLTPGAGARVLAYAAAPRTEDGGRSTRIPDTETLRRQRQAERDNALMAVGHPGLGSVLMLGFDQTWRWRARQEGRAYDRFWAGVLRWATADGIAAGPSPLRIGAAQPRYTAGSPVQLVARIATPGFMPVIDATPHATLWSGNRKVLRRELAYRPGSPGLYTADIGPLPDGPYRVELETAGSASPAAVSAEFAVVAPPDREGVELAPDHELLERVAALTGGRVLDDGAIASLPVLLGAASVTRVEQRQIELWNGWPWFTLIVALLAVEWTLRKRARLP